MGYLAIARKWRPSRFEDLVGQSHVVQTLKNAILLDRVSHAYLFSGARGIGKTSVARIFAKALRCPNAKEAVPCNECPECVAISESRSVDVVEIDGASNNGVEAVRGIRDNVAYSASSGFYKIYIIDEVHMLSLSAFNALLKTLEEPPKHVIFLFATTEVQKIPLTVLGRCQRFEFRRLTQGEIVARLKKILEAESVPVADEGLMVIAAHSDGSLRDAQSLLDQVLSFAGSQAATRSGQVLTEKDVVRALGVSENNAVSLFLKHILDRDVKGILQIVDENYRAGVDLKHFAERCLEELRLLYLTTLGREQYGAVDAQTLDLSSSRFAALQDMSRQASLVQLERMAQIFTKTIRELAWSSLPRFVLEMAAVRMCELDGLTRLEASLTGKGEPLPAEPPAPATPRAAGSAAPVSTSSPSRPAAPPVTAAPSPVAAPPVTAAPSTVAAPPASPPSKRPAPDDDVPPPPDSDEPAEMAPPVAPAPRLGGDAGSAEATWKAFVEAAMKKRPLLGALLCHADFELKSGPRGKAIAVSFQPGSFYEREAMEAKNRSEIEALVKTFFGKDAELKLSSSAGGQSNSIEAVQKAEADKLRKEALEHPSVEQMKTVLGAEVVDVNVEVS